MAEWQQQIHRLMQPGIFAFVVVSLLCRQLAERKRGFALIVAETSGGIKTSIRLIARPIMNISALVVKSRLQHMAIRTESTVPMSAT